MQPQWLVPCLEQRQLLMAMGGGWRPSIGGKSTGKSKGKKFGLYFVSKAEGFCMGFVGTEKRRFCCGGGCFVHAHKSSKFQMPCESGWFIPAKEQSVTRAPTAFVTPFLDSAKITKETLAILKSSEAKKTTAEWEAFISYAKEEWEDLKSKSPLRAVEEMSSKDSEESEEGSVESTEGELFDGVYLSPEEFGWKAPVKKGPDFTMLKSVDESGACDLDKDVDELQIAVGDLGELYPLISEESRDDAKEMFEYSWKSTLEIIKAIDRLNHRVQGWKGIIGDFGALKE